MLFILLEVCSNDLEMDELGRWKIEEYHQGLKQVTNVKSCQCWKAHMQRSHIGLALRAFLVFERYFQDRIQLGSHQSEDFSGSRQAFRANSWIGRYPANA